MNEKTLIRNVEELPDWYDLSKYEASCNLDASSWYDLVLQRYNHFFYFEMLGAQKYLSRNDSGGINPFRSALIQLRENPLALLTNDEQIALFGGGRFAALKYDEDVFRRFSYSITPLTFRNIYSNESLLEKSVVLRIRAWVDNAFRGSIPEATNNEFKNECEWAKSFIDKPLHDVFKQYGVEEEFFSARDMRRSAEYVRIDMSVPDKILIKQFREYLRLARESASDLEKALNYKHPQYHKWVEYSVLPYLDLSLWAFEENLSIPNRVMADAIYQDGHKGEETVRKTTSKIAKMLMEDSYHEFLATIAAQEIVEKT